MKNKDRGKRRQSRFRVGADIGGTFTDIVFLNDEGTLFTKKVSSSVDDYARAIVEVGLSYEQNATEALRVLEEVAEEWAATDHAREVMVEEAPQVQALLALGDSAVTARVVVQVQPGEQFPAERQLRSLIKTRFDERGIEIPFPRRTVYVKSADGGPGVSDADAAAAGA